VRYLEAKAEVNERKFNELFEALDALDLREARVGKNHLLSPCLVPNTQ